MNLCSATFMARPQQLPDYPDEIKLSPMFHPDIGSRQAAESYVLQNNLGEGSYVVRPNTDNDPSFVSITTSISGNQVCNAKVYIEKSEKGCVYYISEKLKFPTFSSLLGYYCEHRIHCKQGIDNLRLSRPLMVNKQLPKPGSGDNHRSSSSSSGSDGAITVVKQPITENPVDRPRIKTRANSESQIQNVHHEMNRHGGSVKSHISHRSESQGSAKKHQNSSSTQSLPEGNHEDQSFPGIHNYANSHSIKQHPKSLIKCRPPAPLPRPEVQTSDDKFYYTTIEVNKDFFRETYTFLKEIDRCECGLRLCDSELPLGWTLHCSQDPTTLNHIFFQHGETTTWEMPVELTYQLTPRQVNFIIYLCQKSQRPVPMCLKERVDRENGRVRNDRNQFRK